MKQRRLLTTLAAGGAILGGGLIFLSTWTHNIVIPESRLQEMVQQYFPIEQNIMFFLNIKLENPQIMLENNSDRIKFKLDIDGSSPLGSDLQGTGLVSGKVSYVKETGEFFIVEPQIENIQVQGMPADLFSRFDQTANQLLQDYLQRQPVYKITSDTFPTYLVRLTLKEVEVKDQNLILKMRLAF
uniref:DUF1439 domain-containing protein n=1 Tax=Cyanothece sp. (strain PCC 7425 / ATCC 29141) TaxID=395961 RepID=B8HQE7_CYAP4